MEVEINQDALGLRMCQFCFTNCMLSCSNRLPLSLYQNLVCFEMQQTQKKKKEKKCWLVLITIYFLYVDPKLVDLKMIFFALMITD